MLVINSRLGAIPNQRANPGVAPLTGGGAALESDGGAWGVGVGTNGVNVGLGCGVRVGAGIGVGTADKGGMSSRV